MRRFLSLSCAAALVVAFSLPAVGPAGDVSAAPPPQLEKILVRGAAIHGANGLAVDHAGRLLVASVWGQQITAVDRSTGRILQRYGPVVDGVQLGTPDDVAVGPDGSIYYTDIMGGNVGRISADGHLTKQPVATFNNPIAFDAKGRLFVAQAFQGDCLYEVDPALVKPPTRILCGSGEEGFPEQLNGFDFGPDGMLYAPRPALRQIVRIDIATRTVTVVASDLDGNPSSVEFDAAGHLYASLGQGPVVRVDIETGAVANVTTLPFGLDNMAFDSRGRLYVSNSDDGHVDRVLPATGSRRQLLKGGLIIPGGVAVMPQAAGGDRVVVADLWRVATYNGLTGRLLDIDADFGAFGAVPGVTTTAADGDHVILTSWIAEAVTIWDPAAKPGSPSTAASACRSTRSASARTSWSRRLAPRRSCARTRGCADARSRWVGFVPTGLAATADDLWVADWATGTVWQLVKDGATLTTPGAVASGLAQPEGLAVDRDGSLLVVEAGAGRLTRIDPATGATSVVATGLGLGAAAPPGAPPTWMFNGVAVGPKGDIYATGDTAAVIYRFSPVP